MTEVVGAPVCVDLFAGIGGGTLAATWAGFQPRLFCEIDPFCQKVLAKHWPDVPCHDDVHTLDREVFARHDIDHIDLLIGGFPCQPWSNAGRRQGFNDERHLWPAMLHVIRECRPTWVIGENVEGFARAGLDRTMDDLEGLDYAARAFVYPALAVGAPHHRRRLFIVAHAASERRPGNGQTSRQAAPLQLSGHDVCPLWSQVPEPDPRRMADGLPTRLDRAGLKALGNAIVPAQIFPLIAAIRAQLP